MHIHKKMVQLRIFAHVPQQAKQIVELSSRFAKIQAGIALVEKTLRRANTRATIRAFRALDGKRRGERHFADLDTLAFRVIARTSRFVLASSMATWKAATQRKAETRWQQELALRKRESRLSQIMLRSGRARLRQAFHAWVSFRTYMLRMKVGVALLRQCVSSYHRGSLHKSFHGWFGVLRVARCKKEHSNLRLLSSAFQTWSKFVRSKRAFRRLFFALKGKREERIKFFFFHALSQYATKRTERRQKLNRIIERTRHRILSRGLWRLGEHSRVACLAGTAEKIRMMQHSFQAWKRCIVVRAWRKTALARSILEALRVRTRRHL